MISWDNERFLAQFVVFPSSVLPWQDRAISKGTNGERQLIYIFLRPQIFMKNYRQQRRNAYCLSQLLMWWSWRLVVPRRRPNQYSREGNHWIVIAGINLDNNPNGSCRKILSSQNHIERRTTFNWSSDFRTAGPTGSAGSQAARGIFSTAA
jgi:hypothetical protein